jgi:predicted dehydrogenase
MRLAIMSFAHVHAEGYAHNLKQAPGVEFMGIADDDPVRGRAAAERHGTRFYESYDALLADRPDGVVICCENTRHREFVEMAAAAGVHVLCEKPLATTVEDAQAIMDACKRARVTLMTAFPMRFSAPAREVKQIVDGGTLGAIYGISSTNNGQCPYTERGWFIDPALSGGGAMTDHIVHLADLLRWYLSSEVVEVYAQSNRILYSDVATEVETGGLVSLLFDNGTFATIDCSWSKPLYYPTWGGLAMELVGEGGFTVLDAFRQNITVYSAKRQRAAYGYWGSDANQAMVNEFVAAVREQRAPLVTGYDGLKASEIVVAAYRSAALGEPVRLPLE